MAGGLTTDPGMSIPSGLSAVFGGQTPTPPDPYVVVWVNNNDQTASFVNNSDEGVEWVSSTL
jgi:hypothetical protein